MTNAIPDDMDLLLPMAGGKTGADRFDPARCRELGLVYDHHDAGCGVMRWRRDEKRWRPVSFVPVTGDDNSLEPSLIRDIDGSLLFGARGGRESTYNDIRVWRSQDGGETWAQVINVSGALSSAPVSLNQAADGTPYVVSNLYEVLIHPMAPQFKLPLHRRFSHFA